MKAATGNLQSTISRCLLPVACCLLLASAANAQQQPPRIGYACPAGGQQGTTAEIIIGGQFLDRAQAAHITGQGVKATLGEHVKPINQKEFNDLREKLQELMKKQPPEASDAKEIAEIRKKISTFLNRPASPTIAETLTLQVAIAADAPVGERELRVETPNGLSNPLVIRVGTLPEITKRPSKPPDAPGRIRFFSRPGEPRGGPPDPPTSVTLPAVINGQILPGGTERFTFKAAKGQKLVIATEARDLIPYIADAVPGWFQATITLYDSAGREVAYADHWRYSPDPVLCFDVPKDDEYLLDVHDSLYRGREDFVFRITIGELPFVTSIFPLGGRSGEQTTVGVTGWNLPTTKLTQDSKGRAAGAYPIAGLRKDWLCRHLSFGVDTLAEVMEAKPNGTQETAQAVTLPVIINGRIELPGQWSVFRFDGRAGEDVVAEVMARRLGSPLDSVLRLTDGAGRQIAFNDDCEDKAFGLDTHYADSFLRVKLPAAGAYYVWLGDAQRQSGPDFAYRLRLSPPRPDYELRVAPSAINARGAASVPIEVYAVRKDGFAGDIDVLLKDAPAGFTLSGGKVPAGQDSVRMTLSASGSTKEPVPVVLEGRAKIDGRDVVRKAVPAEDMMQAFAYRHLVVAQEMEADVSGRAGGRGGGGAGIRILSPTPVRITPGRTAVVRVGVPESTAFGTISLELSDPPAGISVQTVTHSGLSSEIMLACDAAKAKPGLKGNLIVNMLLAPRMPATTSAPARPVSQRRIQVGVLPAIPFEVVSP
ncbi:MAG: hypothetical protein ACE15C_06410 [Phycisphaerae bacterium]